MRRRRGRGKEKGKKKGEEEATNERGCKLNKQMFQINKSTRNEIEIEMADCAWQRKRVRAKSDLKKGQTKNVRVPAEIDFGDCVRRSRKANRFGFGGRTTSKSS